MTFWGKGFFKCFLYLNPLSCATDTEDLHSAKLCGTGAFLCTPRSVFLFGSVRYPKPHSMAKENQDLCSSPALVMALRISDGLSPLQDACGTGGAGSPAAQWPFRGVGPGADFWGLPRASGLEAIASFCVAPAAVRKAVQETRREGCRQDGSRRRLPLTSQPFSSPKPAAPTPPPKAPAADGDGLARAARPPTEPLGHR